jgi:uncharacterized protein (DUF2249 family)
MILDIRTLNPSVRPATVFKTFDALAVGAHFEIVNDHESLGVARMLDTMRTGTFRWDALESGPDLWRARISRIAPAGQNEPDATQLSCGCHHG